MRRAAFLAFILLAGAATAEEPAALVARLCGQCHEIPGIAPARGATQGPPLAGIIGRTAGTAAGFDYSSAMIEAGQGGLVWQRSNLARYLAEPQAVIPGTFMAAPVFRNVGEIAATVAFVARRDAKTH